MGQIVAIATNQIVMMFLLMAVGYVLYRKHFLTAAGISQMSDLVLFVANPVLSPRHSCVRLTPQCSKVRSG